MLSCHTSQYSSGNNTKFNILKLRLNVLCHKPLYSSRANTFLFYQCRLGVVNLGIRRRLTHESLSTSKRRLGCHKPRYSSEANTLYHKKQYYSINTPSSMELTNCFISSLLTHSLYVSSSTKNVSFFSIFLKRERLHSFLLSGTNLPRPSTKQRL